MATPAAVPMLANILCLALLSVSAAAIATQLQVALPDSTSAPIVNLGYAQYQGSFNATSNITSFLNISYAAPPVGSLRFQAPQPPMNISGVQQATSWPNMCPQADFGANSTSPVPVRGISKRSLPTPPASEDCLYLNVWTPGTLESATSRSDGRYPVLVWIHGGGYVQEYSAMYNGADLVLDGDNGVVVVVIQYRLGLFGFLAGSEMKERGSLNSGLLDQQYALKWVQKNIAAFGGDPSHVTIWGESAGAGSVLQHIVANGGNTQPPLFHAGITSSTFLPSQYAYNHRVPEYLYSQVVAETGCASSSDTFACLQYADVNLLERANENVMLSGFYGTYLFVPVVDGDFIAERPSALLEKGKVNGDLLLAFGNADEGYLFVNQNETMSFPDYIANLFPDMTREMVDVASGLYGEYDTPVEQATLAMGDSIFVCPTYYLMDAFVGRTWKGIFAIPPAYHGQDCIYYFNADPPPYDNTVFIKAFSQSFLSVARSYDVNAKFDPSNITPYWQQHFVGNIEMLFNRTEDYKPLVTPVITDPTLLQRCAFWQSITSMTAQ